MKQELPIINLDDQWYLVQGAHLQKIDKPETLDGSNIILTDFSDAVSGLEMVTGPVEHAAALIEKRLRDIGLLDGPSKIIVHDIRKVGDTATVIFTAIPADTYTEYFEMVNKQKDHCLIVPLLCVLCKQVDLNSNDSQAIVFHHNREFDLLIVKDKKIKRISRLTSFSTLEDDVNQTLETLAKEIDDQNTDSKNKIKSIKWFDFLGDKSNQNLLSNKLYNLTGIEIIDGSHVDIIYQNKEYQSSILHFFKNIKAKDAANDKTSRMLYVSEKILPLVAAVFITVILYLLVALWQRNEEINDIKQELSQSDKKQLRTEIIQIKNDLIQSNKQFAANKYAQITSQWLYNLNGIQSAPNPRQLVRDIGRALPEEVQIIGISLDSQRSPATVVLDGVIDKPLKFALKDLESMSTKLLASGYSMQSNSSIEIRDNNDFRMTLKVDYNDK